MPTWLNFVKSELEALMPEDLIEPSAQLTPQDHIIGEADLELRRLFGLAARWEQVARVMVIEAQHANNSQVPANTRIAQAQLLLAKTNLVRQIFWVSVRDSFDLWNKPQIGIREGWQIVWTDCNPTPSAGGTFSIIMGG